MDVDNQTASDLHLVGLSTFRPMSLPYAATSKLGLSSTVVDQGNSTEDVNIAFGAQV